MLMNEFDLGIGKLLGGPSPEDIAQKGGPAGEMMKKLLAFKADPKYASNPATQQQIEQRIKMLMDRLNLDAGVPVDKSGMPKQVVPPEQFKDKINESSELGKIMALTGKVLKG